MTIPWAPHRIPQTQPAQVHLSHGLAQWLGDSRKAAQAAGKKAKRGGLGCTDTNVRPLLDGAGCEHSPTPREGGWLFLAIGDGRRRALTSAELDTPFARIPRSKFVRLRRTRRPGLRFASRVRPLLFAESVAVHRRYGATPVYDLKAAFPKRTAISMVNIANRQQQTVYFKALVHQGLQAPKPGYSMAVAGEKLRTFHAAGGQTALATHGYPKPSDLEQWRDVIDAYWGSNAKEYRP
jgi:hypothetical protein